MARAALFLIVTLMAAGFLSGKPAAIEAHAVLARSVPTAGEVVPVSPAEILIEFTETTDRNFTHAQLYDAQANLILDAPLVPTPGSDLILTFTPPALANGTYTVVWRNVSTVDGHPMNGSFSFHVGERSEGDVAPINGLDTGNPPKALSVFSRWFTFAAHVLLVGIAACTLFVLIPTLRGNPSPNPFPPSTLLRTGAGGEGAMPDALGASLGRMLSRLWWAAVPAAVLAAILALVMQAWRSAGGFSEGLDAISDLVSDSRFGRLWLARMVILGLMAYFTLALDRRLFGNMGMQALRHSGMAWAAMLVAALALVATISLGSHAAASQESTRELGTFADFLHMTAAGVWLGGLVTLALAVTIILRISPLSASACPEQGRRREGVGGGGSLLRAAVPRFSMLAIASVVTIALTGVLQWYLRIGNLDDTLSSGYGLSIVAKTLLLLPMLVLGALNLLVLSPGLRDKAHEAALATGRFLRRHVIAEAGLGALVLLATAFLTDTSPPASTASTTPNAIEREAEQDDLALDLTLTPGVTGPNNLEVAVDDTDGTEEPVRRVIVRLRYLDGDFGQSDEAVEDRGDNTYAVPAADFGVAGNWEVVVIVQRQGVRDVTATFEVEVR